MWSYRFIAKTDRFQFIIDQNRKNQLTKFTYKVDSQMTTRVPVMRKCRIFTTAVIICKDGVRYKYLLLITTNYFCPFHMA